MKKTTNWPGTPVGNDQSFIPTSNKQGYMLDKPDKLMQAFINEAKNFLWPVVDVGSAYGVATQAALMSRAKEVLAIDPALEHIDYMNNHFKSLAGERLRLLQASFPCQLPYQDETVGAFLFSRVFHFFSPIQIEQSLDAVQKYLIKGGRVFVLTLSIYTNYFKAFIPEYISRLSNKVVWPGMINNLQEYLNSEDAGNNPESIHLFTTEVLSELFKSKGFEVECCEYATRDNYPSTIKYDGREDVMLIAKKI